MEFHTVYDSFEIGGRDYIGKHSTSNPYDEYKGSYKDKTFKPEDKIIIGYSKTPEGAVWLEMQYQQAFKVVEDPQFANQSYQTTDKFVTGFRGEEHPMYGVKRPDVSERNIKDNPSRRPGAAEKISQSRKNAPPDTQETRIKKGISIRNKIKEYPDHQSEAGTKAAKQKYTDPDHPELGVQNAGNLAQMQKRRGYPLNKIKVG